MQHTSDPIYKLGSKGETRVWYMEQDGDKYRTWDGILGGTVKASEWRSAYPTNVGRANERDGTAQATFEIEAAYTKKLKREYHRDLADVEKGAHYFKPMLAEGYKHPKKPADKVAFEPGIGQPKLDGGRCLASAIGPRSRTGEVIPGVPHIPEALAPLMGAHPDLVLDGELYNHELRDDFEKIMSKMRKGDSATPEQVAESARLIQYHVYDMPSHPGTTKERLRALVLLLGEFGLMGPDSPIRFVPSKWLNTEADYDAFHGEMVELGFEGTMLRRDTAYEQKRTYALLKRKDFDDAEFDLIPGGIEAGEGNWANAAKRVVCWLPDADRTVDLADKKAREENTFEAGIRGTKERGIELLGEEHHVVTIRYFGFTGANRKPRFGVATQFHGAKRTI